MGFIPGRYSYTDPGAGAEMKYGRAQLCFAVKKRVECRRPFAVKKFFPFVYSMFYSEDGTEDICIVFGPHILGQ